MSIDVFRVILAKIGTGSLPLPIEPSSSYSGAGAGRSCDGCVASVVMCASMATIASMAEATTRPTPARGGPHR